MRASWCRFCGEFGLADRMVCASSDCQSLDLVEDLGGPKVFNFDSVVAVGGSVVATSPAVVVGADSTLSVSWQDSTTQTKRFRVTDVTIA